MPTVYYHLSRLEWMLTLLQPDWALRSDRVKDYYEDSYETVAAADVMQHRVYIICRCT